jgi:sugar phosphate isomerase/epimerase
MNMNSSRRDFLKGVGGVAALSAFGGCASALCGRCCPQLAAQLYSIHKIFWKRPEWCLAGLKDAGYAGVEFAGYGGHTAKEIRKYLAEAGIVGMGTHVNGFVDLKGDGLAKTLDFCAEAGIGSVTTPHALCKTADEYRQFGRDMSVAAEKAVSYGIKVGIHTTYDHFRVKFNGLTAWETIFSEASPLLQQQIDTSNTFHVIGDDLLALLEKYRGRHYSVHLKENVPSATATLGEPPKDGGRTVPWQKVLACLAQEDVAWYVVEAEAIPDSLEPLANSLKFLKPLM